MTEKPDYLAELHLLLDNVLNPRFASTPVLRKRCCEKLLALLEEATRRVEWEVGRIEEEEEEDREPKIRHTLENTNLEKLPDEEELENEEKTIHGEK